VRRPWQPGPVLGFGTKRPVLRPMGASVGWQGTSRAYEYATLRATTRTNETKLRKSGRVLTSHRRSARWLVTSAGSRDTGTASSRGLILAL
jgi:hypothetical protein